MTGMAEFIVNPRRAPRAPARCRTAVASASGSFEAETEDIGARGCQVVSPKGVRKGDYVKLTIANDNVPEPLRVSGRIAWVSAQFPWRVGIAFDEGAIAETTAWVEKLVATHPGLRNPKRLPDRIPVEAMVYLGTPPRFVVDFDADEAALLRAIGSGSRVDELMARFRSRGPRIERALFSLIARSAVTLAHGSAVHPHSWKPVLDEVEALLAVEALGTGPATLAAPPEEASRTPVPTPTPVPTATPVPIPVPAAPARPPGVAPIVTPYVSPRAGTPLPGSVPPVSPFGTTPQDPSREVELDEDVGLTIEVVAPSPPAPGAPGGAARDSDLEGKGVGWRKPSGRARSGEAQAAFDRARAEFAAGNVNGAIALLRRALALAPGDPEIADVLGKLAFRERDPGAR
jgi:hypothetical protein